MFDQRNKYLDLAASSEFNSKNNTTSNIKFSLDGSGMQRGLRTTNEFSQEEETPELRNMCSRNIEKISGSNRSSFRISPKCIRNTSSSFQNSKVNSNIPS